MQKRRWDLFLTSCTMHDRSRVDKHAYSIRDAKGLRWYPSFFRLFQRGYEAIQLRLYGAPRARYCLPPETLDYTGPAYIRSMFYYFY